MHNTLPENQGEFDFNQFYSHPQNTSAPSDRAFAGFSNLSSFGNSSVSSSQVNQAPNRIIPQMSIRNQPPNSVPGGGGGVDQHFNGGVLRQSSSTGSFPGNSNMSNGNSNSNNNIGALGSGNVFGSRSMNELSNQSPMLNSASNPQQPQNMNNGNPQFDMSNFPMLSSSSGSTGSNSGARMMMANNLMMNQASPMNRDSDFTILNEDFPALPGSQQQQGPGSINGNGNGQFNGMSSPTHSSMNSGQQDHGRGFNGTNTTTGATTGTTLSTDGLLLNHSGSASSLNSVNSGSNNNNNSGNGGATVLSKDAKYGLTGLLDVIRMTDRDLNMLALGSDLTTYGLNLTSVDCLYATFSSPFVDQPSTSEPSYTTPSCYLLHPPTLKSEQLSKLNTETLFYMFYHLPKDVLQMYAAQELYKREWKFHGELKVWLKMRSPQELLQSHPSVAFLYFDATAWEARLFTTPYRGNIVIGLLSDEDIRVKAAPVAVPTSTLPVT